MPQFLHVHHVVVSIIYGSAVALNALVVFLVCRSANGPLRRYRYVLLVTFLHDLLFSAITFICQPAMFYNGNIAVSFSNGFFAGADPRLCYALIISYSACLTSNLSFLPVPFLYRYFLVCRGNNSRGLLLKLVLLPAISSLAGVATTLLALGGTDSAAYEEAQRIMSSVIGEDSAQTTLKDRLFVTKYTNTDLVETLFFCQCVLAMVIGYALIVFCQFKVFRHMRSVGPLVNRKTQRLQSDLHKALLALAAGPLLSIVIPGCAYSTAMLLHVDLGRTSTYIIMSVTAITLLNPLATLFFVRPFRRIIYSVLSCRTHSPAVYSSSMHFVKVITK